MLIEFSVNNYLSFSEQTTFSLEAADIASQPATLDTNNVFSVSSELQLLTSAAIYGANASGKSNLIKALRFMRNFVLQSSRESQAGEPIAFQPFLLSTETGNQPSEFEIIFLIDGVQYRYEFAINAEQVLSEGLYRLSSSRETTLFTRDSTQIKVNSRAFREGHNLEQRTRPNALFLSVVAQFNGEIATTLLNWFRQLWIHMDMSDQAEMLEALHVFEHSPYRHEIEQLIKQLDVNIDQIEFERGPASLPPFATQKEIELFRAFSDTFQKRGTPLERVGIKTYHQRYDIQGEPIDSVVFDFENQESAGTQRLFMLAYPIIRTLHEGLILVIDEIDARIHPNLVIELIRLFNDPLTNPFHAQLIFTTHNTNLLSAKLFRRDQIWFVEKSRRGISDLYSLVEYRLEGKTVRNDASFEKEYITGRYGAIPFIGDLEALLKQAHEKTTAES